MLEEVWERFYPTIIARVGRIEEAAGELAGGAPDAERMRAGREEAHRLAGVLGTFGLKRAGELARALELAFEDEGGVAASRTEELAAELRALVERAAPGGGAG